MFKRIGWAIRQASAIKQFYIYLPSRVIGEMILEKHGKGNSLVRRPTNEPTAVFCYIFSGGKDAEIHPVVGQMWGKTMKVIKSITIDGDELVVKMNGLTTRMAAGVMAQASRFIDGWPQATA